MFSEPNRLLTDLNHFLSRRNYPIITLFLQGMHQLVTNLRFANRWDVYINLSADSLPVYTPQTLSRLFDPNPSTPLNHGPLYGINFVTASSCPTGLRPTNIHDFPERWHKRAHY